jgi:hypothetical protein
MVVSPPREMRPGPLDATDRAAAIIKLADAFDHRR